MKRLLLVAGIVLAVLIAVLVWWRRGDGARGGDASAKAPPHGVTANADGAPAETPKPPDGPGGSGATPAAAPRSGARSALAPEARAKLEAALAAARARRAAAAPAPAPAPTAPSPAPASSKLPMEDKTGDDSAWEHRQFQVMQEMLGECYELGLVEDPALAGKVMLLYTISGEPDIGGLVSDIRFDEGGTTIGQATMRECMAESLYALELDPPPEGVSVSRQVTLELEPD
jgi:hypothetical protein